MIGRNFYRTFEDRYRGSRDLVKSRLQVYVPFLESLERQARPDARAIDLGCGRGEWLETLKERGFDCVGIDIDEDMLSACAGLGLSTQKGDAIAYLKHLPDESQLLVSGFHLAEHLSFDDLQMMVQEALRVLKPAGLLILETPNPENITVGCSTFYLDPTHDKPLPPDLLAFLPEYYGFKRTKVLRLQEAPGMSESAPVSLFDVLTEVSPDYAVVAQKDGEASLFNTLDRAFLQDYGLTLEAIAGRYQRQQDDWQQREDDRFVKLQKTVQLLEVAHHSLINSRSWKVTAPLRAVGDFFKAAPFSASTPRFSSGGPGLLAPAKQKLKKTFMRTASLALRQPWLKGPVMKVLARSPKLRYQLRLLVHTGSLVSVQPGELSPHAAKAFKDLKQALGR